MSPEDFATDHGVSRETLDRLRLFADRLTRWNTRINLVAPSTIADLWQRHIADSAQLVPLAPLEATRWLDLGSGAGLPGLVVAALRPDLHMTLVESDQRKAAFLRTVSREMGLAPQVLAARIEALDPLHPDVLSARALAPLPRLLDLAARHAGQDTVLLFPKGAGVVSELTAARTRWHSDVEQIKSITNPSATILRITGLRQTNADD